MGRGNFEGEKGRPILKYTAVICAKMAEPIKMSFGFWGRIGPRNHVLDEGADHPWEWAILRGERGGP